MSKDKPTEDDIIKAVQASGYLMEQDVATTLEGLGFVVETNVPFEDPDQAISREYDVGAWKLLIEDVKNDLIIQAELICECKNKSAPVVFIGRNKSQEDIEHVSTEYIFPWNDYLDEIDTRAGSQSYSPGTPAFKYFELAKHHYYFQTDDKAVQFCFVTGFPNKWEANHAGIYNSLFYPIIKAMRYRQAYARGIMSSPATRWTAVWLFFPIVVLSGDMYYIDSRENPPSIVKKDHVTFTRSIQSQNINGKFMVEFVTLKGLPYFINNCLNPFIQTIVDRAIKSPEDFLPKNDHY